MHGVFTRKTFIAFFYKPTKLIDYLVLKIHFLYDCEFPLLSRNHNFHILEVNNVCLPILGRKTGLFSSPRTGKHCFPALGRENRTLPLK